MTNRAEMLRSRLALLLGLGSFATACGGKVIFEGNSGGGVGGAGSTTSSTHGTVATVGVTSVAGTGTGTTTGGGCTVQGPPGDSLEQACFDVGQNVCPPIQNPMTKTATENALNQGVSSGCAQQVVDLVACGPDSPTNKCCYWVYAHHKCVEGRPFEVGAEARTAEIASRSDWCAGLETPAFDLDEDARAALSEAWAKDALFEHASVASFARFTLELLAVGAPADLVRDAQVAMGDEIHHAKLAFALASRYAGAAIGPSALRIDDAPVRTTLIDVVAATVREGCVNETIAALVAAEARDLATDPVVRAALEVIAADEARHAELAWRSLSWALSIGGPELRAATADAFSNALEAILEATSPNAESELDLSPHGQLDARQKDRLARHAVATVLRPVSAALLDGGRRQSSPSAHAVG